MSGLPRADEMRWAGVLAAVLVAAIALATVAYARSFAGHHPAAYIGPVPKAVPSSSPSLYIPPSPSPTPRSFVWDADLVDASTGWLLLQRCTEPSPPGPCEFLVTGTADGGQTWGPAVNIGPPYSYASDDGSAPRSVHFLTRMDGFVYGSAAAFATHDGGQTWTDAGLSTTSVDSIVGRVGQAWEVTSCSKGTTCPHLVRSSTDGGHSWSSPHPLPDGISPLDTIPFGSAGLLVSNVPSGDMQITSDGGATWRSVKTPCAATPFRGFVATPDGNELWQLCMSFPSGDSADKVLFVSEDAGKTWAQKASTQTATLPQSGSLVSLVSNRPRTAFIATERTPISVTHDAGLTWAPVARPVSDFTLASVSILRFASPNDAWAVDNNRMTIWATSDGGVRWSQVPI